MSSHLSPVADATPAIPPLAESDAQVARTLLDKGVEPAMIAMMLKCSEAAVALVAAPTAAGGGGASGERDDDSGGSRAVVSLARRMHKACQAMSRPLSADVLAAAGAREMEVRVRVMTGDEIRLDVAPTTTAFAVRERALREIGTIQQILGHANVETTATYTHVTGGINGAEEPFPDLLAEDPLEDAKRER